MNFPSIGIREAVLKMSKRIVMHSIIVTGAIVFFAIYNATTVFKAAPDSELSTTKMRIGDKQFTLEIANTSAARQTGLMRRDSMPADHGMIFVFRKSDRWSFYMKNTRIPLDLLFIDESGKIRSIHQLKPYDLNSVTSDVPVKYAIELNEGMAKKAGAKVGDRLYIPEAARDAKE
jgi:uncharacterized protein